MYNKTLLQRNFWLILSLLMIFITALIEYFSPKGVVLSWGYIIAVFFTTQSKKNTYAIIVFVISIICILLTFTYQLHSVVYQTFLINRVYALIGLIITLYIAIRVINHSILSESNRSLMEGIFSHGTETIILTKQNGEIVLVNPYIEKSFGYNTVELAGKNINQLIPEIHKNEQIDDLTSRPLKKDMLAIKKDNSSFSVEISLNKYKNAGETYEVAFITDISNRKRQEQILLQQKQALESVNKELEAFSYSVSHDLRAPLRAVGGFSKMLIEDYNDILDNEGKRLLKVIQQSAEKMGNLIDDLLSFSHLGRKEIRRTSINMVELVNNVLYEVNKVTPHHAQITIKPLPDALADAAMISLVWTNLLSNAIKYSSKVEKPYIEISSFDKEGINVYYIKDNGAGYDMQYAHKLFGVFQRLHTNEEFDGTGVGLATAKRIIQKHGGEIWAEGTEGSGATFYFTLDSKYLN